jgi:hypothetical protein
MILTLAPQQNAQARLAIGTHLPTLQLPADNGHLSDLTAHRQRRNLVLVLLPAVDTLVTRQLLATFTARVTDFAAENAELLVVAAALPTLGPFPVPVLFDFVGALGSKLAIGDAQPLVYIADRAGLIYAILSPAPGSSLVGEALEWVAYLELRCPE